jgi:FkbM family methyltransferase
LLPAQRAPDIFNDAGMDPGTPQCKPPEAVQEGSVVMQQTFSRKYFDCRATSIGARVTEELRESGWHAVVRACVFVVASVIGRKEFTFSLMGHPFRVRANRRKLGVDGLLFARRERFEPELKPYFRLDHSGTAFFDIGANYGYWSRFILTDSRARGVDDISIVAFEPVPSNYQLLVDNMKQVPQSGSSVSCEQIAVSDTSGTCFMNLSNGDPGSSFASDSGSIECRVTSIDEYVEAHHVGNVALMKIDVEGFELRVLKGARRTILRDRPMIVCEVIAAHLARAGATSEDLMLEVNQLGYTCQRISDADYILRPRVEHVNDCPMV